MNISVQMSVPAWVQARSLGLYQMVFMGGMAAGSAFWGRWRIIRARRWRDRGGGGTSCWVAACAAVPSADGGRIRSLARTFAGSPP